MSLFKDGRISTLEDLQARETEVLDVAAVERIDLASKLDIAADEIGTSLTTLLLNEGEPGARELDRVVVTPPLSQWHVLRTLANVYRDAYQHQLNDRYKGKWQMYAALEMEAVFALRRIGVGMVHKPIPAAEKPDVSPGLTSSPPGTYYVRVTWTDADGQEGAASEPVTFEGTGAAPAVRVVRSPSCAIGWNVYVGANTITVRRQNQIPLEIGNTWTAPGAALVEGPEPSEGQRPDYYVQTRRLLQRG